jgi:hypothetical protein
LDEFGGDRLEDLIENLNMLLGIDMARLEQTLTPTLYLIVREKLVSLLIGNLTPETRAKIMSELASAPTPEPAIPEFEPVE